MEWAEAADANFVLHASWVARQTEGMEVWETPALVFTYSGLPCDTFNILCRARLSTEQAVPTIRQAIAYFREREAPFSWWVGPADRPTHLGELLQEAGLARAETELAMGAELADLPAENVLSNGLEIRRVRRQEELEAFAQILGGPEERRFYARAAPVLLAPDCPQWLYVGYLDGHPVATAEGTVSGGMAGLYNISTLEASRRRGIGTAMTLQPLLDARAQGCRWGCLQAAAMGVGLYQRLGFQSFGNITEYK